MRNKRIEIMLAVMAVAVALLFCSCVKDLPKDGQVSVDGRETLFAPAESTLPNQTEETESPTETTAPDTETTAPQDETTTPATETTAPETTDTVETENPFYTGGFSGLY